MSVDQIEFPGMPDPVLTKKPTHRDVLVARIGELREEGALVVDLANFLQVPLRTFEGWCGSPPRSLPRDWMAAKLVKELRTFQR